MENELCGPRRTRVYEVGDGMEPHVDRPRDAPVAGMIHVGTRIYEFRSDDCEGGVLRDCATGKPMIANGTAYVPRGLVHEVTPVTRGRRRVYLYAVYEDRRACAAHARLDSADAVFRDTQSCEAWREVFAS